jgi:hypothetical protein
MKGPLLVIVSLIVASTLPATEKIPPEWHTVAENTEFRATSSYDDTVDFLRRIAAVSPAINLESFGRSAVGRRRSVLLFTNPFHYR